MSKHTLAAKQGGGVRLIKILNFQDVGGGMLGQGPFDVVKAA